MNEAQQIDCKALKATLSPLTCLQNRIKALVLAKYPGLGAGMLRPCLSCQLGRKVRAYLPAGDQA